MWSGNGAWGRTVGGLSPLVRVVVAGLARPGEIIVVPTDVWTKEMNDGDCSAPGIALPGT
jgi:hypothetical protein